MTDTLAFLLDKSELKAGEIRLLKRLYKNGDVSEMLKYERNILEVFWKISQTGQVIEVKDLDPSKAVKQLSFLK